MPKRRPLISVCMPTRNCAPYLAESMGSVLSQPMDLELLVCDDGSTDDTPTVVRAAGEHRVRYLRHRRPRGVAAARNSCLEAARGRYLVWMDSDDRLLPGAIRALVEAVERDATVGLAHGAFDVIAADGRMLPPWPMPFQTDVVERAPKVFRELAILNHITAPVIVRRECHDATGPFATDIGPGSTDWEMWLRMALHVDIAYVARRLSQYRQHDGSISATASRQGVRLKCDAAAVARVFALCRQEIPDATDTESLVRLALLAKAVLVARDAVAGDDWPLAAEALAPHLDDTCLCGSTGEHVLAAVAARDELALHRESRAILGAIQQRLAGTRLGSRLAPLTASNDAWDQTLLRIAATMQSLVPTNATVAAVDKWDPTLLRLAGRAGYHFPDRGLMPGGYPPDDASAIAHLEELQRRGTTYLVVPNAAFWWLEHYRRFAGYLETAHERVWRDAECVIFRLVARSA